MLTPDYISKIEGHGKLNIDFEKNKAKLIIDEGERYFEALVLNRPYYDIPFIVSRICGVCPTAHYLASLKALENALNVTVSDTSILLRKIILLGQIVQSHILHAFFLALPDYANTKNLSDLAKKIPAEFSSALKVKTLSDKIVEIIGGRPVHPVSLCVGGFTKYPSMKKLVNLRDELENDIDDVANLVKFFANLKYPKFVRETKYLAIENDKEYGFYEGDIIASDGFGFKPEKYKERIMETVKSHSTAKYATYSEKGFMVGAIARIFLHSHKLSPLAKAELEKYFADMNFPSCNPYHNNLFQVIEILYSYEELIKILNLVIKNGLGISKSKFEIIAGTGTGAIEAPRGTLYHSYKINKNGIVIDCDIITPTVQNLTNIEDDMNYLLKTTKNLSSKKREKLIEMLIRAYDPCITCSVH